MNLWKYIFGVLGLALAVIVLAIFKLPDTKLHLTVCDVGQGDAILATYENIQILVDGGPNNKVLDCLAEYIPLGDTELELVILTHPQEDHFGGLIEVFKRYKVDTFLANGLDSSTLAYKALKNAVGGSEAKVVNPKEGMELRLGKLYLDILAPSDELLIGEALNADGNVLGAYTSSRDSNEFSIVALLRLGDFDALLTGDISPEISDIVAGKLEEKGSPSIEYFKVPHHGSKNGLTPELLEVAMPKIAVVSVGKNSYGHPSGEIIKMLEARSIKVLRTDEVGNVEVVTDGESYWLKD